MFSWCFNCRWLHFLTLRIEKQTGLFGAEGINHVLLNAYKDGSGIHSHQDGPIYQPAACILSIGASAVIDFSKRLHQGECRALSLWMDNMATRLCRKTAGLDKISRKTRTFLRTINLSVSDQEALKASLALLCSSNPAAFWSSLMKLTQSAAIASVR